ELTQEDITTGAGNDIDRATEVARRMVREWGMSKLGPLSYGNNDEPVFLGRDFSTRPDYSEDTAIRIDQEVDRIVQAAYERAKSILIEHRTLLDRLAQELLELESLDGRQVYEIIRELTGEDLAPPSIQKEEAPDGAADDQAIAAREAEEQERPARDEVDAKPSRPRPAPTDPLPSTE
ncbi:MAG: ATP-dependent zinc metalloprotease FtsH, partial [Thermoanaerobaculia bacterium]